MKNHPNKIKMIRTYEDKIFAWLPTRIDTGEWVWLQPLKIKVVGIVYEKHQKKVVVKREKCK